MKKLNDTAKTFISDSLDKPIDFIMRHGRAHLLPYPKSPDEMTCDRCNGISGHVCHHEHGKYMWFCLNPDCLNYHSELSKKIARLKF